METVAEGLTYGTEKADEEAGKWQILSVRHED